MKKTVVLLLLVILMAAGCEMYKTKDVLIDNQSNQSATLYIRNIKEGDKKILETSVTVNAGKAISLPFYSDGEISLQSIGRNFLKKISNTHYSVLDSFPILFKVYNTTSKDAEISDKNNLFDSTIIPANSEQMIQVYNPQNIQPKAKDANGALDVKIIYSADGNPTNKLRITY